MPKEEPTFELSTNVSRRKFLRIVGAAGAVTVTGCGGGSSSDGDPPTSTPTRTSTTAATRTRTQTPQSTATATPTGTPTTEPTAAPTSTPTNVSCVVRPEQTEGPYFVDEMLNRSNIRTDPSDGSVRPGTPLVLTIRVFEIGSSCTPLAGAMVDIWHCDADGLYSDIASEGSAGRKFLRGLQVSGADGSLQFTTIYPGWYPGRAVHIHFKIRVQNGGSAYDFTSQLYFDDSLTDQVFTAAPYVARGTRSTRNPADGIFRVGGDQLTLSLTASGSGYAGTFDIGLDLS